MRTTIGLFANAVLIIALPLATPHVAPCDTAFASDTSGSRFIGDWKSVQSSDTVRITKDGEKYVVGDSSAGLSVCELVNGSLKCGTLSVDMLSSGTIVWRGMEFARIRPGDAGFAIYKGKCAPCHGPDGRGQTPIGKNLKVRDLSSSEVQKQTDQELYALMADGKNKMPAYKDKLSAAEIKELLVFIRTLATK